MEETEEHIKSTPVRKKGLYLMRIFLALVIFLITAELVLLYLATPLLRTVLQKWVYTESRGIYTVDFDRLSINLGKRSITLEGFNLVPDTMVYSKLKAEGTVKAALYDIRMNSLNINQIRLFSLYRKNILSIREIELKNISVRLLSLPKNKETQNEKYDAIHKDLFPFISKYVDVLKVDKIKMTDGYLDLYIKHTDKSQASIVNHINIVLTNFYLDENRYLQHDKIFYSDNVEIRINNYMFALKDKIHLIKASEVILVSGDSLIDARDISILPIENIKTKNQNIYQIIIPHIRIQNFNFGKAFFERKIHIQKILMEDPSLKFIFADKNAQKKDTVQKNYKEIDLYKLIDGKIKEIAIDSFRIADADFRLYREGINTATVEIKKMNLVLKDFKLNKESDSEKNRILYSKDIQLFVDNYKFIMPDKMHYIKTRNLFLSTEQKRITAKGFELISTHGAEALAQKNGKSWLNISVPYLDIVNADFFKAFHEKYLPVGTLYMSNPVVKIEKFYQSRKKANGKSKDQIYGMIEDFFNTVTINTVQLKNGTFDVSQYDTEKNKIQYINGNLSFVLKKFLLDPNTALAKEKFFYANDLDISLNNFSIKPAKNMHVISISNGNVSTINKNIFFEGIKIHPVISENHLNLLRKYRKDVYADIDIQSINLTETNIHEAYYNKNLKIAKIFVKKPEINITKIRALKETFLPDTSLLNLYLNNTDSTNIAFTDSVNARLRDSLDFKKEVTFYQTAFAKFLSKFIDTLDVNQFSIDSGFIKFTNKDTLQNIHSSFKQEVYVDLYNMFVQTDTVLETDKRIFFSDDIQIRLKDYSFSLPDKIHEFKAREIKLSSKTSKFTAKSVFLQPDLKMIDSLNPEKYLNIYFPNITATGFDIRKLIYEKKIYIDSVFSENPVIIKINQPEFASKVILRNRPLKLKKPKSIKDIEINNISLLNTRIGFNNKLKNTEFSFLNANIDLYVNNFKLDSAYCDTTGLLNQIDNIAIHVTDLEQKLPDSLHTIKIGEAYYSTFLGAGFVKDFKMQSKQPAVSEKHLLRTGKSLLFDFDLPEIQLWGLDLNKYLFEAKAEINAMQINELNANVTSLAWLRPNAPKKSIKELEFFPLIRPRLKWVNINQLNITDAQLSYNTLFRDTAKLFTLKNISAELNGFKIDSTLELTKNRLFFSDNAIVKMKGYKFNFSDSIYCLQTKEIGMQTKDSVLWINSLNYIPKYDKSVIAEKYDIQRPYFFLHTDRLQCKGADLAAVIDNLDLTTKTMTMDNVSFHTFYDRRYKPDTIVKKQPRLQDFILDFKKQITTDTLLIRNMYISYEEVVDKAKTPGILFIDNVNITATNLTNNKERLKKNDLFRLKFTGKIMGDGNMNASFKFPMNSAKGEYTFGGTLDTLNLQKFNPYIEYTNFVTVKSGTLNSLRFTVSANNSQAVGQMRMNYSDLKININSKDTTSNRRGLTSLLANTLIPSNNPKNKLRRLREGIIYEERDSTKSFFTYWMNSLISGAKSSLGFKTKELKKHLRLQKILSREKRKENRENRRTQRKLSKEIDSDKKQQNNSTEKEQTVSFDLKNNPPEPNNKKLEQEWSEENKKKRMQEAKKEAKKLEKQRKREAKKEQQN